MPEHRKVSFSGRRDLLWVLVFVLMLAVFWLDYSVVRIFPFVDLAFMVPIVMAAIFLGPVETVTAGLLSTMFCLASDDVSNEFTAVNLWSASFIALFGLLTGVLSIYVRRFLRLMSSPREALESSPLAYARFSFPGYRLIAHNQAFEQMSAESGGRGFNSLASAFPAEAAARMGTLMDRAAADRCQIEGVEFSLPAENSGNTFWNFDIIPDLSDSHANPLSITLFAFEITDQVVRNRIRETSLRISTTIMSSLDVNETVRLVLDGLIYITGTDVGALFLLEDEQWERRAMFGDSGLPDGEPLRLRAPYDDLDAGVDAIESRQVRIMEAGAGSSPGGILPPAGKSCMVVPLVAGSRPVGAVWLNQTAGSRPFTRDQVEFASVIGSHGALAIENASIYEKEQAARASLEAIEAVSEAGLVSLDIEEVLSELVNRTQHVMKMDAAVILLADESRRFLELRAMTGEGSCPLPGSRIKADVGLAGRAFRANAPMKIDDLLAQDSVCPLFSGSGMRSALMVPLRVNGDAAGVLAIGNMRPAAFSVQDWELIQVIADRASLAVQNSLLHNNTKRELAKAALLRDVAAACAGDFDLKQIAQHALQSIYDQLGCQVSSIYYLDDKLQALVNLAFIGSASTDVTEYLRIRRLDEDTMLVRAVLERRLLTQKDLDPAAISKGNAYILHGLGFDKNRMCTGPLIYGDDVVGAMAMLFPDKNPFSASLVDTVNSIANQMAVAIHVHRETAGGVIGTAAMDEGNQGDGEEGGELVSSN